MNRKSIKHDKNDGRKRKAYWKKQEKKVRIEQEKRKYQEILEI